MPLYEYKCSECGHDEFDDKKISVSGTGLSKMFDIQSNEFTAVSCKKCGFTKFFKGKSKAYLSMPECTLTSE